MTELALWIEAIRANVANPIWDYCIEDNKAQLARYEAAYDALETAGKALGRIVEFESAKRQAAQGE